MKRLSCREARGLDLVEFLNSLGHQPKKVRGQDYWYFSPFREEKTPSFKVNRTRNIWFDFGEGKGGDIIDFGVNFFRCSINELLEKLSSNLLSQSFSFQPLIVAGQKKVPGSKIVILEERPLTSWFLVQYLQKRCIPPEVARQYCLEMDFKLYGKKYTAIGFRNDKGGFELRNEYFKGSSSPKAITFFNRGSKAVAVFEGFFDFLSFQTIHAGDSSLNTNCLVLNSLSFFHQVKDMIDKHQTVNLYLDNDKKGIECTQQAIGWGKEKCKDLSKYFRKGKDLNDWLIESQFRASPTLILRNPKRCDRKTRRI